MFSSFACENAIAAGTYQQSVEAGIKIAFYASGIEKKSLHASDFVTLASSEW
jgi:hypothetical protein